MSNSDNMNKYAEGWDNDCGFEFSYNDINNVYCSDNYKCMNTNCPCLIRWIVYRFIDEDNSIGHEILEKSILYDECEYWKCNSVKEKESYYENYIFPDLIKELDEHISDMFSKGISCDCQGGFNGWHCCCDYISESGIPKLKFEIIRRCLRVERIKESTEYYLRYNFKEKLQKIFDTYKEQLRERNYRFDNLIGMPTLPSIHHRLPQLPQLPVSNLEQIHQAVIQAKPMKRLVFFSQGQGQAVGQLSVISSLNADQMKVKCGSCARMLLVKTYNTNKGYCGNCVNKRQ